MPPPANSSLSQSPGAAGLDHFSIYGVGYIPQRLLKPEQANADSREEKARHPWLSLSRRGPGLEGAAFSCKCSFSTEPEPSETHKPCSLLESRKLDLVSALHSTSIQF